MVKLNTNYSGLTNLWVSHVLNKNCQPGDFVFQEIVSGTYAECRAFKNDKSLWKKRITKGNLKSNFQLFRF